MFCAGLHPSQQLTKYDGEVAATGAANDVAFRLSGLGAGDGTSGQPRGAAAMLPDSGTDYTLPSTGRVPDIAERPAYDPSELYRKPTHVIGSRETEAELSTANDQIAAYPYEDQSLVESNGRKPSLTGNPHVIYVSLLLTVIIIVVD